MVAQFLNDPLDVRWLRDVHLPDNAPAFQSFEIYGNEDSPERLVLHAHIDPSVFDTPVAVYELNRRSQLKLVQPARLGTT